MVDVNRIKERASEQGITLKYLASLFGLGRSYFQDVQKRNGDIPDDRLLILAERLNTTPEYLKGETDVKERKLTAITGDELKGWEQDFMHDVRQLNRDNLEMLWKMARTMAAAEKNSDSQEDV